MFNLLELQQQRSHKALTAKELVDRAEKAEGGPRPMTPEEISIFDRVMDEIKALDGQIAAVQAHQKRAEESKKLLEALEAPDGRATPPDQPARPDAAVRNDVFRIPATAKRTAALKAFKGGDAEQRAYRSGLWLRATVFNDVRAQERCMNLGVPLAPRNAMGGNSNTDGGFLVIDEMSQAIIDLREQYGVFRRECRVWPMGSDTLKIPRRAGGVTIGAIGENPSSAISQSNPTFDQVMLVAKKAGGLTLMSSEVSEDAVIDLADWVANEFAYGFALFEDQCGFIGDGTSTYLGIRGLTNLLTTASSMTGAVAAASGHDTFAEVDASDIAKVMGALPQYASMGAKFYCSRVCAELVFGRLQASAGGNTVSTLSEQQASRSYLGYPIVISQVLPTSTSTINGTALFFFGNLSMSSSLGDRRQLRIFPSEHRYMDTDQIGIRGTERMDINNHDVGTTSAAGAIVGLMGTT